MGNSKPEEVRYRAWFDSDTSRRISKSKTGQRSSMQPDRCHPPPNQCHRRRTGNSCFRASGFCAECPGCRARRGVLDGRIRLTFQTGAENTDERRAIGKLDANRDSRPPPSFCSASAALRFEPFSEHEMLSLSLSSCMDSIEPRYNVYSTIMSTEMYGWHWI